MKTQSCSQSPAGPALLYVELAGSQPRAVCLTSKHWAQLVVSIGRNGLQFLFLNNCFLFQA